MFNRRKKKKEDKGFLCPSCMQNFVSAEEVQLHYDEHHSDLDGHVTEDQGEGFLCPVCKISLASPEDLQSHYVAEHSEAESSSDSHHARNGEITGIEIQELRKKLEQLQSQLQGSEERSSLLSSQVFNNEQKVAQFTMRLEIVAAQKDALETTAAQLVGENALLKLKVEEYEQQQKVTDKQLTTLMRQLDDKSTYATNLEIQLAGSEAGKDNRWREILQERWTSVLTKGKINVDEGDEESTDTEMSSLGESESALQDLRTSFASLEIDFMQEKYKREKLQEQLSQLTQALDHKQAGLNKLQGQLTQYEEEKTNLENILQTTQTNLQQVQAELATKQNVFEQSSQSLEECLLNISHLQEALDSQAETLRRTQETGAKATGDLTVQLQMVKAAVSDRTQELEDLRKTMVDSESTSQLVVLQKDQQINDLTHKVNQLQTDLEVKSSEMTDLQIQLSDSNSIVDSQKHHCDNLKAQMLEQDGRMEEKERQCKQLEDKISDLENCVLSMSEEKQRLENERHDLVAKIETGEGASELIHQIQQENSCLQEKLTSLKSTHQGQVAQHFNTEEALLKQIREVRGQLQESEVKISKLETALDEKSTQMKIVQQKLVQSESELPLQTELLLASEATRTTQIAALDNQIKEANSSLEKAGSDLSSTKSQLDQANRDVAASKDQIVQLLSEVSEQRDKIVQLLSEVSEQRDQLASADHKFGSLDLQLKDKVSQLAQAQVEKSDMELTLEANKQILIDSKGKLIKAELELQVERRSRVTEIGELTAKLEMLTLDRTSLQQKYDQVNSSLVGMEGKYSQKCTELDVALQNLTLTQAELKKIEDMFSTTKDNSDDQLMYLTTEFEKDKSKANEVKEELMKQVRSLTEECKHLKEERMAFGEQVMNLSETLQQNISESDSMKQQMQENKLALEADIQRLQTELLEASTRADEYQKEVSRFKRLLAEEQEDKQQTLAAMRASKDLLLQHKSNVEAEFIQLQGEAEHWSEQLAKVKQEAHEVQTALRQDNCGLLDQLTTLKLALDTLQTEKDEIETEFDTQSTLLSDNLTAVRTDLTIAEGNLDQLTRINDQLRGERLEMEVKLERCHDERRMLLERCVASERENEKLRENFAEQRYHLEDIQGALHELGRENQTLQMTTTTVQGRKWTDDSDVTECTSCGKMFSVIVRKHHCRHCGHIFCSDCSSKITQTPMKRKAARVCDPCFRELSVQRL